jgi:hypothetical protein
MFVIGIKERDTERKKFVISVMHQRGCRFESEGTVYYDVTSSEYLSPYMTNYVNFNCMQFTLPPTYYSKKMTNVGEVKL